MKKLEKLLYAIILTIYYLTLSITVFSNEPPKKDIIMFSGTVLYNKSIPIEGATVSLIKDGKIIEYYVTMELGTFSFNINKHENYSIRIERNRFEKYEFNIHPYPENKSNMLEVDLMKQMHFEEVRF